MQHLHEEVRVGDPLVDRVSEQRLHLRAGVDVGRGVVQLVDVDDERELLDQALVVGLEITVPCVGTLEQLRRLPDEAHESRHHQRREDTEVERPVEVAALGEPREHAARHDEGDAGR